MLSLLKTINNKNSSKGSLTVEACVSLPIFLGFFLLLLIMIKIAYINIVLDHAVNEAAKQIATSAYPISFLNEYEDRIIEEDGGAQQVGSLKDNIRDVSFKTLNDNGQNLLSDIFSGNLSKGSIDGILSSAKNEGVSAFKNSIGNFIISKLKDSYWDIKNQGKYLIVKNIMDKYLKDNFIDKNNLQFKLVELPQGDSEFENGKGNLSYSEVGLLPEREFGKDDVVIQLEYKFKFSVPVLGTKTILFKHTAVEKAWLHGGNGVYTERNEGLDLQDLTKTEQIVYVTKTGEKYHKASCYHLRLSKIPIDLSKAKEQGYGSCKHCKP